MSGTISGCAPGTRPMVRRVGQGYDARVSLTSQIKDPASPARRFLDAYFPLIGQVAAKARRRVAGAETIRPAERVAYQTVGTAIDYRIRYCFGLTPAGDTVAGHGMDLCTGMPLLTASGMAEAAPRLSRRLVARVRAHIDRTAKDVRPVGRRLDADEEGRLARCCYLLALFEQVFRGGVWITSPLFGQRSPTLEDLLALVPAAAVADLRELVWAFCDTSADLLASPATLNPTFAGSLDVGGADADFVVGGCLVDIKTTVNSRVETEWLRQLLGYALLDYDDEHAIRSVGLYLARQRAWLRWGVDEVLAEASSGAHPGSGALRRAFRAYLVADADALPSLPDLRPQAVAGRRAWTCPWCGAVGKGRKLLEWERIYVCVECFRDHEAEDAALPVTYVAEGEWITV